jgi:2-keto-4-pentenoate hydratase
MHMLAESVQAFAAARRRRPAWPGIEQRLRPASIADGYRLQREIHAHLAAAGDALLGWKVGSTSATGQRGFGLTEPVYAGLMASGCCKSLADALHRPMIRPSLECEIAFLLRGDLDGADPDLSLAAMMDAVGACHIACEIIDQRYGDPLELGVPSLIADDFFQAGFVVGPENTEWRTQDLATADGFIDIDGHRATGSARSPDSLRSDSEPGATVRFEPKQRIAIHVDSQARPVGTAT